MTELKKKLIACWKLDLFGLVGMRSGSLILCSLRRKIRGKIRVCIDFRNLNKATPKDEYPMPIADMLINEASGHHVIVFLMVISVTIKYLWPKKIYLKRPLDVRDLSACLSGWL